MIELMRIKTASDRQVVRFLSGGNQQKVVLGKWLCLNPKLLLLDEPTRGIDVGAKEEIYKLMDQLAGRGVAILFASSEMEEIIGLSDRALVMHEGRIAGELSRAELSEEAVMRLATGDDDRAGKDRRMMSETKPSNRRPSQRALPSQVFAARREDLGHLRPAGRHLSVHGAFQRSIPARRQYREPRSSHGAVRNPEHRRGVRHHHGRHRLSIGSLVCLVGVLLPYLLAQHGWPVAAGGRRRAGHFRRDRRHPRPA